VYSSSYVWILDEPAASIFCFEDGGCMYLSNTGNSTIKHCMSSVKVVVLINTKAS